MSFTIERSQNDKKVLKTHFLKKNAKIENNLTP